MTLGLGLQAFRQDGSKARLMTNFKPFNIMLKEDRSYCWQSTDQVNLVQTWVYWTMLQGSKAVLSGTVWRCTRHADADTNTLAQRHPIKLSMQYNLGSALLAWTRDV